MPDPVGDDGRPDARLAAALAGDDGSPAALGRVLAALSTARIFLALSAEALDRSPTAGVHQESSSELSLMSVLSGTGRRALPAFLGGNEVQRWRREARPVPVTGQLACRTVLDDKAAALLLDPLGMAFPVSGDALEELAAGRVPVPGAALSTRLAPAHLVAGPPAPPALLAALGSALAGEPVDAARLLAGPAGPVLGLVTALGPAELAALAARLRERLAADLPPAGLDLAAVPPDGPGEPVPIAAPRRRGLLRRR